MELNAERVEQVICTQCNATVNTAGLSPFSVVTCQSCGKKLHVPARIENLLLLKPIGKGGMGVVYRALDTSLRRTVAVKVLKKDDDKEDAERARMILQEARSLALLNHPNVVHVFSIGTAGEQPYIVMELVDGGRFDKLFGDNEPGDEITSLQITIDAAEGLRAALNAGLVHGDVKPGNILLNQDGIAKIIDFGIARKVDDDSGHGFIGTPYYVAPEIVRGHKLDHRCDIYSLGASLFNVLTAKRPFTGKDVPAIVRARLERRPPNVRAIVPTLHPETAHVVDQMLEPDPNQRYQSYDDLIEDLRHALAASQSGPVDMEMAELSAAAFEQQTREVEPQSDLALDQSYSRGGHSRSRRAQHSRHSSTRQSRSVTRKRSAHQAKRRQKKKSGNTGLVIGIIATIVIAIIAIFVVLQPGSKSPTIALNQRMDERFTGGNLPQNWASTGIHQSNSEGNLQLAANPGKPATIRRPIGNQSGRLIFVLGRLSWNRMGDTNCWFRLADDQENGIEIKLVKSKLGQPTLTLNQLNMGVAKLSGSIDLTDTSSLAIEVDYDANQAKASATFGQTSDTTTTRLGGSVNMNALASEHAIELGVQAGRSQMGTAGLATAVIKRVSWIPK